MKTKKLKVSLTKSGKLRLGNCCPSRDHKFVIALLENYFGTEDALSGLNPPKRRAFALWEMLSEIFSCDNEQLTVWFYFSELGTDSEMVWRFS